MTADPKLGWNIPTDEWKRFEAYVHDKHGRTEGRVGREIRQAMREWVDADEFAAAEQRVDRLVRAAGRTPAALAEKKRRSDPPSSEKTTEKGHRAPPELQKAFAASADENDAHPGVHLARALRERRTGGRAKRILGKLDRVVEDAEALLGEVDPQGESEMSVRERRTIDICARLGEEFWMDDLDAAIGAIAGDSPPTLRAYRERVLDRRDYVEHPHIDGLYIPKDTAREYAEDTDAPGPDAPAFERKDYSDLTRGEKVHGLRVALARRAVQKDGRIRLDVAAVRREVFESEPSDSHARTLMRRAGQDEGFDFVKRHGKKQLQVNLRDVTDDDLRELLGEDGGPSR